MTLAATGAVLLAATLDRLVAEPPARVHPVAWLGRPVAAVDHRFRDSRAAGVAAALGLPLAFARAAAAVVVGGVVVAGTLAADVAWTVPGLAVAVSPPSLVGGLLAGLVLFVCSSHRMLVSVADEVVALTETDLDAARERLRALAGRDAADLSAAHVRSAAVESAAENLADGHVAPLFAFALAAAVGSLGGLGTLTLPLAAGAAAWVKGVNTLDSMLGYREKPVGWAPARLDDLVMWVPARLAAALVAVAAGPLRAPVTLRDARWWARVPSSPNSGWPMATLAVALGVRLEKPDAYALVSEATLPDADTARRGVRTVSRAGWLGVGLAGVIAAV